MIGSGILEPVHRRYRSHMWLLSLQNKQYMLKRLYTKLYNIILLQSDEDRLQNSKPTPRSSFVITRIPNCNLVIINPYILHLSSVYFNVIIYTEKITM
jgi:hypothetical protein